MDENDKYAVLFDLDGTLIDSLHIYYVAVNDVLSLFGISCTYDEMFAHAGVPGEELYTHFLKKCGKYDLSMKGELKTRFDTTFLELLHDVSFPKKSADVITELKTRGYTIALCTGATRNSVNAMLPEDVSHLFSSIVTCDDVSACKPNPETFLKAADDIGIHPSNCVVVGDGMNDLVGASMAGMKFVLVRNAHNTGISEGYTEQIDDITELVSGSMSLRISSPSAQNPSSPLSRTPSPRTCRCMPGT
jgi:beta-phosphoglucomutase